MQLERTDEGRGLLNDPQRWIPGKLSEVRKALADLLEEIVESVNFYIQEEVADKGDSFDPKVTFKSQEGVRAVENAVGRDIRRTIKRPGGDAFLFSVEPAP